jgi:putative zinc finger/helix-turn-helix YgiT family protein
MSHEVFCPNCEDYRSTRHVERPETYTVRDRQITVPVATTVCAVCGEAVGSDEQDQVILDAVHAEYRRQTDLLTPERIKEIRQGYRLSQKSFALLLGMSEVTINRYERGGLQDAAHDTAIRVCEKPQVMRDLLRLRGHLLSDWQRRRAEDALAGRDTSKEDVFSHLGEVDWICMPREITDRTGFRRFEYQRFAAVVLWFCERLGETSRTVINKLLFYADFLNYRVATVSLTGTAYRRVQYGPVPADYDGLLSRMESESLLAREERVFPGGCTGYYYKPGPKADSISAEFSAHEIRVLECVADSLGKRMAKDISERSHQEPAWRETEDGKLISYQWARQLSLALPD